MTMIKMNKQERREVERIMKEKNIGIKSCKCCGIEFFSFLYHYRGFCSKLCYRIDLNDLMIKHD